MMGRKYRIKKNRFYKNVTKSLNNSHKLRNKAISIFTSCKAKSKQTNGTSIVGSLICRSSRNFCMTTRQRCLAISPTLLRTLKDCLRKRSTNSWIIYRRWILKIYPILLLKELLMLIKTPRLMLRIAIEDHFQVWDDMTQSTKARLK